MRKSAIFPRLEAAQINFLNEYGTELTFESGEYLIKRGEKNFDLFVILEGEVSITDPSHDNHEIVCHGANEFTGDSDILSERASVFDARSKKNCKVLKISHDNLKKVISINSELSDLFLRAFLLRRDLELKNDYGVIKLIGSKFSKDTFRIREFLSKNQLQYNWIDPDDDPQAQQVLDRLNIPREDTPIVINTNNDIYKNPEIEQIAACTGVSAQIPSDKVFDVIIVGAGPGGLAASVYAASEGLSVLTLDQIGPGGQAGTSSKIENYLGFPTGISGWDLAKRAYLQAQKFGCILSVPHTAKSIEKDGGVFKIGLASGDQVCAKSIIAATGAHYRRLPLPNISFYEGKGIFYGATQMEAQVCTDKEVIVVGGGNSAGQAAIFLAGNSKHVHMVIRGDSLKKSMSEYLIKRIEDNPKITLHTNTEVTNLVGESNLEQIELTDNHKETQTLKNISNLFLFIGAIPCNDWLEDHVCLDEKGFVTAGRDLVQDTLLHYNWKPKREPMPLETCIPGLFVVGDLRSGSTKRVASAVGEGSMAVSFVHTYLSELQS